MPLLSLYLMKLTVDAVTAGIASPDKGAAFRHVLLLLILAGLITITTAALDSVTMLVTGEQAQAVTDRMHALIHGKAVECDLGYYENADYHDTLHRAQQEAPFRPTVIVTSVFQLAQNSLSLLGIAGLIVTLHPGVTLVVFAAALPAALVRIRSAREGYTLDRSLTLVARQAHYFNDLLTTQPFAKEIRLFNLGPLLIERSAGLREYLRRARRGLALRRSMRDLAAQMAAAIPVVGFYVFIAARTLAGAISLGSLVMYYQALQRAQGYLRAVLNGAAGLYEHNLFLANLYEFLDLEPRVTDPPCPRQVPSPMRTGLVVDRVSFQYPGAERRALDEVSLHIRPGEVIALVGENGSGKTTLVKLLCRLYDAEQGGISIDGVDLREFKVADLRREISVVFQDYVHYYLTARENIWFGNTDLAPDDPRVIEAARRSGADSVIRELRDGYDTHLGRWLEDGEELSVGQWQKVALARAFLRDAQILILDEPSSALDPRAEMELFEKFRELVRDRTAILISHRLSTVKMADRIYVMQRGRIVESGTHSELVDRQARYAELFEAQARSYR